MRLPYTRSCMSTVLVTVFFYASSLLLSSTAVAQQSTPVTIETNDGSMSISGTIVSFDGKTYEVQSQILGILKFSADTVVCTGAACPEIDNFGAKFGIHGSRTVGTTLIPNLLRGYADSLGATYELSPTNDLAERTVRLFNSDGSLRAEIDLQTRGSGSAFKSIANGVATIGIADRRMKDSDAETLAAADITDLRDTENEVVIGVDGIVIITHPDNPVRNLSALDIAQIWSGEITNWLELGGGDIPIVLNSFSESSGDREIIMDRIVRPNNRDEAANVTRWNSYQDMIDAVIENRGGIGYSGRWLAQTNDVNVLDIREECGLLSPPSNFRIKIEGYTLSRRLYAYTKPGRINREARAFLDWTLTDEAQQYIKESHFVDRELERMRLEDMGMMLVHTAAVEPDFNGAQYTDMMQQLRGADRLSVSFRFRTGSSVLDVESVRTLEELAVRMESGEFDGLEVLLVGFADSVGGQLRNTTLAQSRASAVRIILANAIDEDTLERLALTPLSYGELLPLSCNGNDTGRARNRRVEVWLRLPDSRSRLR